MKILLSILGLSYLVSPYDLCPDIFLGIGWLDDLIVLGLLWWYLYVYRKRRYGYEGAADSKQNGASGTAYEKESFESHESQKQPGSPKDPYAVLGVRRGASSQEIREAYRQLAGKYHPDKVVHLGDEFRDLAEIRFKEIQGAYQELKGKT